VQDVTARQAACTQPKALAVQRPLAVLPAVRLLLAVRWPALAPMDVLPAGKRRAPLPAPQ